MNTPPNGLLETQRTYDQYRKDCTTFNFESDSILNVDFSEIIQLIQEYDDFENGSDVFGLHTSGSFKHGKEAIVWIMEFYNKEGETIQYPRPNASKNDDEKISEVSISVVIMEQ